MGRWLRVLTLLIVLIQIVLSFLSYHEDLEVIVPFKVEISFVLNVFLVLFFIFQFILRWKNFTLLKNINGYVVSSKGWSKIVTNEIMPFIIYLPFIFLLVFYFANETLLTVILSLVIMEGIFYVLFGKNKFKIIINESAVISFTNQHEVLKWANIAKVTFSSSGTLILKHNGRKVFIEDLAYEDANLIRSEIKRLSIEKHILLQEIA
tara:strand:- start:292 stop:912 length:621 start_codon:yes stop_codon:yes gene_type:complete